VKEICLFKISSSATLKVWDARMEKVNGCFKVYGV
jgi:hypothetical protein